MRQGYEAGSVALGGRKVPICRPRVRSADHAHELEMPAYEHFSSTELFGRLATEKMLAELSDRARQLQKRHPGAAGSLRASSRR